MRIGEIHRKNEPNSNLIPRGEAPRDWIEELDPRDFSIYELFFRWIYIPIWYKENFFHFKSLNLTEKKPRNEVFSPSSMDYQSIEVGQFNGLENLMTIFT